MLKFVQENRIVGFLSTIIRLYLGYTWITNSWAKITAGGFDATGFMQGAISNARGENPVVPSWWANFLETVALPNGELFSFMVMWGELLVGIALIVGLLSQFALIMGILMNASFILSGASNPDIQMLIFALLLVVCGQNAYKIGLDRWAVPYLKILISKKSQSENMKKSI
ncbi:MAG: Crp/Fnr family transcriptional regulator [Neobacillus sp.]|nr:Crp/Fnr family transcriptional regulator [Neobacillus sp.]